MRGAKSLPAVVLVFMLLASAAYVALPLAGSLPAPTLDGAAAAPSSSGITSIGPTASTEFLTHTPAYINGNINGTVWKGDTSPQTSAFNYSTVINYPNPLPNVAGVPKYNGFTLFEPNSTIFGGRPPNASANATVPQPTYASAWGWLSGLQPIPGSPLTIPAGKWIFNVGLNITFPGGTTGTGTLHLGVSAYAAYTGDSNASYTSLFHAENDSFSLLGSGATAGSHVIQITANAPRITFNSTENFFTEFYLNASTFTPSKSMSVDFEIGGANASQYNFTYPDYGWISGMVSPSDASLTVNQQAVQTNAAGVFNITAAPMLYTIQANRTGYVGYSERIDVSSGLATPVNISLSKIYSVNFSETGLPSGTRWFVNLTNGQSFNSTTSTIVFNETNGSYLFSVATTDKAYSAGGGSLVLNGSNKTVVVAFSPVIYVATFSETGLPVGSGWFVNISGQAPLSSTNSTITANLGNGSYSYSIGSANSTFHSPGGTVIVNGANVSKSILFSAVTYNVTFSESKLPSGTRWFVNLTNGQSFNSTTSTIVFNETNGSYSYSIGSANTTYTAAGGSLNVSNGSLSINVTFSLILYNVTFSESGLASGSNWSVTINGNTYTSDGQSMTLSLPNGTYSYAPGQVSGFKVVIGGAGFTVRGGSVNLTLTYAPVSGGGGSALSAGTWFFIIVLLALIALEAVVGLRYVRKRKEERSRARAVDEGVEAGPEDSGLTVTQMLSSQDGSGKAHVTGSKNSFLSSAEDKSGSSPTGKAGNQAAAAHAEESDFEIEGGNSYAVFEQTAQGSIKLFESGISKGYRGLCFTRQYPEKMRQKFASDSATVMWLSNLGNENSIRPKDLEKITLLCNESLSRGRSIILIDGLEYLITNNGFITVLKMLQFLRDATAVNDSVLIISINPNAIGENEVNLVMREVDRVVK